VEGEQGLKKQREGEKERGREDGSESQAPIMVTEAAEAEHMKVLAWQTEGQEHGGNTCPVLHT